jgi:hypothetical protein
VQENGDLKEPALLLITPPIEHPDAGEGRLKTPNNFTPSAAKKLAQARRAPLQKPTHENAIYIPPSPSPKISQEIKRHKIVICAHEMKPHELR